LNGCKRCIIPFGMKNQHSRDTICGYITLEHVDDQDAGCDGKEPAFLIHSLPVWG
jgi:hypothetical protein